MSHYVTSWRTAVSREIRVNGPWSYSSAATCRCIVWHYFYKGWSKNYVTLCITLLMSVVLYNCNKCQWNIKIFANVRRLFLPHAPIYIYLTFSDLHWNRWISQNTKNCHFRPIFHDFTTWQHFWINPRLHTLFKLEIYFFFYWKKILIIKGKSYTSKICATTVIPQTCIGTYHRSEWRDQAGNEGAI